MTHPLFFDWRPGAVSFIAAILFLFLSSFLYWPTPEIAFRTDDSPAAWMSSAQMWAMALLSLRLWSERVLPRGLSLWLGLAMMGMAFDEQFMLHEHWKYGCLDWFAACRLAWVTELPMLLVALCGAITVLWLHRSLPTGAARVQLWLALLIGLFALYMRFYGHNWLPYKAAVLVLAQALFAGVLLGVRSGQVPSTFAP